MSDFQSGDQGHILEQGGKDLRAARQDQPAYETFTPPQFDYKSWREHFVLILLRITSAICAVLILLSFPTSTAGARILSTFLYALLIGATLLRIPYSLRAFSLITIAYMIGVNALLERGLFIDGGLFLLATVVLAALLLDSKADILSLAICIVTILIFVILGQLYRVKPLTMSTPAPLPTDWALYIIDFSLIGLTFVFAIRRFKNEFGRIAGQVQKRLEGLVLERSKLDQMVQEQSFRLENKSSQLRSVTSIARAASVAQSIPDLLEDVVNSTTEFFGYYHVGLYLLDEERKNAFLQASSSIAGKQLVGESFKTEDDQQNPINLAIKQRSAYLAPDTGSGVFLVDANFPLSKSRLILPLTSKGDVIGVLDLHSDQIQAFGQEDADVLQPLADLVAGMIDNKRLTDESKALAVQLESFISTQTTEIWSKFTSRNIPAYQYTPAGIRPLFSPTQRAATEENIEIPLILHGERIGNIKLHRKGRETGWSDKEKELIVKIGDQVALALENSRLVDEAQKSAQRDQMIANISSRIRETLDVDAVIRTAATEFRRVFDLKEVEISVGAPHAEPLRIRKTTSSLRLK